jgi:hypothetical protein
MSGCAAGKAVVLAGHPAIPHTCAGVRAALLPPMAACRALNHAVRPAPSLALHSVAPQTVRASAWADGMKHSRCRVRKKWFVPPDTSHGERKGCRRAAY